MRIHRYGQQDAAQVYNLVSYDTIEGRVFLLLEEKLRAVADALGKVDENSEDLRAQVLGQLAERLSFNQLSQEALRDPALRRTSKEVGVALGNATLARQVVEQLFQDLEPFQLSDYRTIDITEPMHRLRSFVVRAVRLAGGAITDLSPTRLNVQLPESLPVAFTTDHDEAMADEGLALLGLEHPLVIQLLTSAAALPLEQRALVGDGLPVQNIGIWETVVQQETGRGEVGVYETSRSGSGAIACNRYGGAAALSLHPSASQALAPLMGRRSIVEDEMSPALRAYLMQMGLLTAQSSYQVRLLGWLEAGPTSRTS